MKRHDFTKGINCVDCGQSLDALMTNGRFGPPKPATPEPPEWIDDGPHEITPKFWQDLADMERKAMEKPFGDIFHNALRRSVRVIARGAPVDPRAEPISRAMSQPGPHDTPMRARLMPWRGEE